MKTTSHDVLFEDSTAFGDGAQANPDHIPSPELSRLVRSFASILLAEAVADGDVQAVEMQRIGRILRKTFYLGHADTERLVREALSESVEIGSLAFENSLQTLRERFLPHQRKRFAEALIEVAESDGQVVERERHLFAYVCKRLGIESAYN
jgi:uncharacterized tellurite resistance protein B-like protein